MIAIENIIYLLLNDEKYKCDFIKKNITRLIIKYHPIKYYNISYNKKLVLLEKNDKIKLTNNLEEIEKTKEYIKLSIEINNINNFYTQMSNEINIIKNTVPVVKGSACDFVDGGVVYFNGADNHTLEAGIGKRVSIVYKVFFESKINPIDDTTLFDGKNLEERELEFLYCNKGKDKPILERQKSNIDIKSYNLPEFKRASSSP